MAAERGGLATRAPAKVNLTLRVRGRRADGYHDLDSIVVFAGCHDDLALETGAPMALTVTGPRAASCGPPGDNLVIRAAEALAARKPGLALGAFHLVKRLPAAAGLGGGSSDAAAALRLLARANGLRPDDPALLAAARSVGADVPVCLVPRATRMRGIGDQLERLAGFQRLYAVLVNPGVAAETRAVFAELRLQPGEHLPGVPDGLDEPEDPMHAVANGRNDLEPPALRLFPAISDVLEALRRSRGCRLARMSGSGATCFGLFDDCRASAAAAKRLRAAHPAWWVKATELR
jgi:4-diphosphocytidyl-2-C-methyl-D-erythritol kinase